MYFHPIKLLYMFVFIRCSFGVNLTMVKLAQATKIRGVAKSEKDTAK